MILSPGEKIKKLRIDLNLKQNDIVDEQVTRNFISMLENGKTKLSYKVAQIIADRVKDICALQGVPFIYSADYLMETVEEQVKKQCDRYISLLTEGKNSVNGDVCSEIESFITQYNHLNTLALSLALAEFYDEKQAYAKEYHTVFTAFAAQMPSFHSKPYIKLLLYLTYCCIRLEKYEEALKYCDYVLEHQSLLIDRHLFAFKYNRTLSFLNLKRFEAVCHEVTQMNDTFHYTPDQKININTLLALAHMYLKNYDVSESILLSMHEKASALGSGFKRMNLSNLLRLYLEKNDLECIQLYYKKCMQSLSEEKETSYYQGVKDLFVDLTIANIKMGNFEEAVATCQNTFDFCFKRNHFQTAIKCVALMIDVYKATLHRPYLSLANTYFQTLLKTEVKNQLTPSFLALQSTFFLVGDCKSAQQLCGAFQEALVEMR